MQRESSKHSPRLDEEMEEEDQTILRSGQPPRTEEWREPEPFDPGHLESELPEEQEPAAPRGMTPADVERRADIARWLPPHKLQLARELGAAVAISYDEPGWADTVRTELGGRAHRGVPSGRRREGDGHHHRALVLRLG